MIFPWFRKAPLDSPDFSQGGTRPGRPLILFTAVALTVAAFQIASSAGQTQTTAQKPDAPVAVKFTDIRKQAGITFLQDSTQTEDKLYLSDKLAAQEKEIIEAALRESQGRVFGPSGAAAKLGIARSTLESKIRSLKINKNRFKGPAGG